MTGPTEAERIAVKANLALRRSWRHARNRSARVQRALDVERLAPPPGALLPEMKLAPIMVPEALIPRLEEIQAILRILEENRPRILVAAAPLDPSAPLPDMQMDAPVNDFED